MFQSNVDSDYHTYGPLRSSSDGCRARTECSFRYIYTRYLTNEKHQNRYVSDPLKRFRFDVGISTPINTGGAEGMEGVNSFHSTYTSSTYRFFFRFFTFRCFGTFDTTSTYIYTLYTVYIRSEHRFFFSRYDLPRHLYPSPPGRFWRRIPFNT